jgi:flagellum-specific peptidoglycan hydrolase FlgJ
MKYPKFLQVLTLAAVVTTALPITETAVYASEKETPKEYEARTEYQLPKGYHYVLSDGKYVVFGGNGKALVEKDEEKKAETKAETKKAAPQEEVKKEEPKAEKEEAQEPETEKTEAQEPKSAENKELEKSAGSSGEDGKQEETGDEGNGGTESGTDGNAGGGETGEGTGSGNVGGESGGTGSEGSGESGEGTGSEGSGESGEGTGNEGSGESGEGTGSGNVGGESEGTGNEDGESGSGNEGGESGEGIGTGNVGSENGGTESGTDGNASGGETGEGTDTGITGPDGAESKDDMFALKQPEPDNAGKKYTLQKPETQETKITPNPYFRASKPFTAIGDRICYNVEVPIEGIPSFITQEMVVGALKAQDETGFPASVTIAQIIKESGYGKYGPGGKNGQGLSYLAYQYCNLFGIKGTGTAGSAVMKTNEMTSGGSIYSIQAGFRVYNTYTECIEDRSKLLKNVYSDLIRGVTDANTFAMKIGGRWATGINYGQGLIKTMETYDLYRLDEMTLMDFNKMIGTFADPCPGSHVTSTFGHRDFDNKFHKGLDLGTGSQNIPTYAAEAGTVTFAGRAGAAGNLIVIEHEDGLVTKYMHHSRMYVKIGQKVEKGQQIGLSGTTGYSTGNHLHFQVEKNGVAMNPAIYLMDGGLQARACD